MNLEDQDPDQDPDQDQDPRLPRPRRLRPRDPWAMQLKLKQTGEGAGESPAPLNWAHSAKGAHPYRKACRSTDIKVAAPPLDSHCDGPVTYPGDTKVLIKFSKGKIGIGDIFENMRKET